MKELVRLRTRPSRDGKTFKYLFDYLDMQGQRKRISLGHADRRKAELQRSQKERELRMGVMQPEDMKLSDFLNDSLARTGGQIRQSTQLIYKDAMKNFIDVVGNIDYQTVTFRHGELFRQACLDSGNRPATICKKLRALKRFFQLAVQRKQVTENPLRYVKLPKWAKRKVEIFSADECERMLKVAKESLYQTSLRWDLLIYLAVTTGMRRAELLNAVWGDVDFHTKTIYVSPKENTKETWEWLIKDTDRRTLPLTDEVVAMLAEHQNQQPEKHPYIFVPPARYRKIQALRKQNRWTLSDARLKVINNFGRKFEKIIRRAGLKQGRFHDFRATALTVWVRDGMAEFEVMRLAGHGDFNTTHKFYLAVSHELQDKARRVMGRGFGEKLARLARAVFGDLKGLTVKL